MIITGIIGIKTVFPDLSYKKPGDTFIDMEGSQGQIEKAENKGNQQDRPGSNFI